MVSAALRCELMDEHQKKLLPLHIGNACMVLLAWVFSHLQHGRSRWCGGLRTLWHLVRPSSVRPGEWVASWWRHCVKRFSKLGVGAPDLRPSERMQSVASCGCLAGLELDGRILEEPSVSTPMLLALLFRLSARRRKRGKEKDEDEVQKWAAFAKAFIDQCCPPEFSFSIFLEPDTPLLADGVVFGAFEVAFKVKGGLIVNMPHLNSDDWPYPQCVRDEARSSAGPISLFRFLQLLEAGDNAVWNIFWQVARAVSDVLEARLLKDAMPESMTATDSGIVLNGTALFRVAEIALEQTSDRPQVADASNLVVRCYFASRQTFDHQPLFMSFSCDCARIGKRGCIVGAVALPSNKFAWCPPQARGWQTWERPISYIGRSGPIRSFPPVGSVVCYRAFRVCLSRGRHRPLFLPSRCR